MDFNKITQEILEVLDNSDLAKDGGAFNLRYNGSSLCHGNSENVTITSKEDKNGIDIRISGNAKGETVHIPVVMDQSGMTDVVYNDFYIEKGADVSIVAGCGIHNGGCHDSRHDGIHTFHVDEGATVRYEEKHYGEGEG